MTPQDISQLQQRFMRNIQRYFPDCFFVEQTHNGQRIRADILIPRNHVFGVFRRNDYLKLVETLVQSGFPILELRGGRKYQNYDLVHYQNMILNEQYITVYARRMVVPIDRNLRDQFARNGQRTVDMFRNL